MILVLDNYDSFTYNLVQYLGQLGADVSVYRNDAVSVEKIEELKPSHVVISPSSASAVTSRQAGRLARSTTSEW